MPNIHFHYLNHALKRELNELYIATLIHGLAAGMLALFTPLYFYREGWSIQHIVLWFALSYAIFFLTAPLGAKLTGLLGHEKTMACAVPIALIYYTFLLKIPMQPAFFWISAMILGLLQSLHWIAYHAEFAAAGDKTSMGEEVGFLRVLTSIIGIMAPAVGGYIIATFGFQTIFIVGGTLITLSIIPMLITKQTWTPTHIGYKNILPLFKTNTLRRDMIGHIATGEEVAAQAIWPIWLFLVIPSYADVGMLTTITIFFTFALMLWIGKLANHKNKARLIKRSAGGLAFAWIARMFALTPLSVFFADSLYQIAGRTLSIPYAALSYTRTQHKKIIEYTTFWMMSLSLGKVLAALLIVGILALTDNLVYTFLISALLSLLFLVWQDSTT